MDDPVNLFGRGSGRRGGRRSRCPSAASPVSICSMPRRAKAASQHRVGRVEGRLRAPARGDHGVAARAQDARDLREERRHVELGDEVEGLVLEGQVGGVGDLERDPSLRVEADSVLGAADHLGRRGRHRGPARGGTPGRPAARRRRCRFRSRAPARARVARGAARRRAEPGGRPTGAGALIPAGACSSKKRRIGARSSGQSEGHVGTSPLRPRPISESATGDGQVRETRRSSPAIIAGAASRLRRLEHGADSDRGHAGDRPDRGMRRRGRDDARPSALPAGCSKVSTPPRRSRSTCRAPTQRSAGRPKRRVETSCGIVRDRARHGAGAEDGLLVRVSCAARASTTTPSSTGSCRGSSSRAAIPPEPARAARLLGR